MKKFLQFLTIATLITWGGVFLFFYLTGRVEKHLDSSFRIYALIAGVGMLILGSFNFINRKRAVGLCNRDHGHVDHNHAHDHHHDDSPSTVFSSMIILLVPLLFATGYSKDQFSPQYLAKWGKIERQMLQMRISEARSKRSPSNETVGSSVDPNANPYTSDAVGSVANPTDADTPPDPSNDETNDSWATFTIEDLKQMVPQNEAGDFQLDVPQIFYTAGDIELMDVMEGIPIETTAQLMEETLNNPNGHRLKAFRLFIECCAADARPLSIPIDFGQGPPEYVEMGWYKLYGKLHYVEEDGELLPILQMERFEETSEPLEGLLF